MSAPRPSQHQRSEQNPRATPGRRRPRATLACVNCRARKVKCDVQASQDETCTACRLAKARCIFNPNDDRRKVGPHDHIATIQERIISIETMMKQIQRHDGSIATASSNSVDGASSMRKSATTVAHDLPAHPQAQILSDIPSSQTTMGLPLPAPNTDFLERLDSSSVNPQTKVVSSNGTQAGSGSLDGTANARIGNFSSRGSFTPLQEDLSRSWNSSTNSPEEEPVRRWEADSDGGPLRFYGPTTRLHSQLPGADTWMPESDGEFEVEPVTNLDSLRLQKVLLSSYWNWNRLTLAINVVDEALFTIHKALQRPSQYYSKFLEDIILACSSRMSSSAAVRRLGQKYAERAKGGLLQQLESPTIASLQGFLLLVDFEATSGRERIGWTYSGIASRLVFDLGLHEDCSDLVKQGKLTQDEAKVRQVLFFAAFQLDSLWSLYFGRPSTISISTVSAVSHVSWGAESDCTSAPTLGAWIKHCTIVAEVANVLNNPGPLDCNALNRLSQLFTETRASYDSLSPAIRCKDSQISELDPSAYALNMQYCGLQIVLHRIPALVRFRKRTPDVCNSLQNMLPGFTREDAQTIKHDNAVRIARLAHTYIQIYGIERVHSTMLDNIFVAALSLISHIFVAQNQVTPETRDMQWLRILSDAIKMAQKHYPVVVRMLRTLSSTVENTSLSEMFTSHMGLNSYPEPLSLLQPFSPILDYNHLDDMFMSDFLLEPPMRTDRDDDNNFNNMVWNQ